MNRRLLGYLVVNVIVSAAVVVIILIVYDRYFRPATPLPPPDTFAQGTVEIAAIGGAGQLDSEAVSIRNSGQDRLSLDGWVLKDASGATYTFPALTLLPGGSVTVHSSAGDDTATDLFWGLTEPIWRSGEFATLKDSAGKPQAVYRIP
jgi:competence protein ComEC